MAITHWTSIDALANRVISKFLVTGSSDPSQEVLFHLAAAHWYMKQIDGLLEKDALVEGDKKLVSENLEKAFRQAILLRARMPKGTIDTNVLTRYGRLVKQQ